MAGLPHDWLIWTCFTVKKQDTNKDVLKCFNMFQLVDLVGGLEHEFYDFPYLSIYWENHDPNWQTHIFQRGRYTTNQWLSFVSFPHSFRVSSLVVPENFAKLGQAARQRKPNLHRSQVDQVAAAARSLCPFFQSYQPGQGLKPHMESPMKIYEIALKWRNAMVSKLIFSMFLVIISILAVIISDVGWTCPDI